MVRANTFKAVLKAHTAVTHLRLSGKKLSGAVIKDIAAGPGRNLVSLSIGMTASLSKVGPDAFLDIFSACPALEQLSIYLPLSRNSFVAAAKERVAAARNGAPSLLRKLAVEMEDGAGFDWRTGLSLGPLSQLGSAFPALEEIVIGSLMTDGDGGQSEIQYSEWRNTPLPAWAPLPALRSVVIKKIGTLYGEIAGCGRTRDGYAHGHFVNRRTEETHSTTFAVLHTLRCCCPRWSA